LAIVAAGANVHDSKLLEETLAGIVAERPKEEQNLCADAGYKGIPCDKCARQNNYTPHIKQRREEADEIKKDPSKKARRWVVERTHSWLNRWRKLLVSFEKTKTSYLALLKLACALISWRQSIFICG